MARRDRAGYLRGARAGSCPPQRAGLAELVRYGETGLLVPIDDSNATANAILRLLDDRELVARITARARGWVEEAFIVERMVERYLNLHREVLKKCSGGRSAGADTSSPRITAPVLRRKISRRSNKKSWLFSLHRRISIFPDEETWPASRWSSEFPASDSLSAQTRFDSAKL